MVFFTSWQDAGRCVTYLSDKFTVDKTLFTIRRATKNIHKYVTFGYKSGSEYALVCYKKASKAPAPKVGKKKRRGDVESEDAVELKSPSHNKGTFFNNISFYLPNTI